MDGTGPQSRRAFLDSLDQRRNAPGGSLIERIDEAERLVELTEKDWTEAHGALIVARADCPEHEQAAFRHLSPQARGRYAAYLQAQETDQRAERAYEAARARLNGLLMQWDAVSRVDLGLPPGPGGWESPWPV